MRKLLIIFLTFIFIYGHNQHTVYLSSAQSQNQDGDKTLLVQNFFKKYNSPLYNEAHTFIKVARDNNLDYRLLPAMSMVESTGAKYTPSCASYNPFGWSSSTSPCGFWRFESYGEAIAHVGQKIGRGSTYSRFQTDGSVTTLAGIYNPGGKEKWDHDVRFFMEKLDE